MQHHFRFTSEEGGLWSTLITIITEEDAEIELKNNHDSDKQLSYFRGHKVHSVMFPSGKIWDSYFGTFDFNAEKIMKGIQCLEL